MTAYSLMTRLLLISFILIANQAAAQLPSIGWQKKIGGSQLDLNPFIELTADGGSIVAGTTYSSDGLVSGFHGKTDIWVVKLNSTGDVEWQKCLGGSNDENATGIRQTDEGGFIVWGNTGSNDGDVSGLHGPPSDANPTDGWIIKLSASGAVEWQRCLGGTSSDVINGLAFSIDGGFLAAGYTWSTDGMVSGNHGASDYWVVKLSASGEFVWQKCYGGSEGEAAVDVAECSDGGYILTGVTTTNNDGDVTGFHRGIHGDIWTVKISASGTLQWQICIGSPDREEAYCVIQTDDGGFIVGATAQDNNGHGQVPGIYGTLQNKQDGFIIKLSASGSIEWQRFLGGSFGEYVKKIHQTEDLGYLVACESYSNDGPVSGPHGGLDYWLVKLNPDGSISWEKSFGGSNSDLVSSMAVAGNNIILAGHTLSTDGDVTGTSYGNNDFWIASLEAKRTVLDLKIDTIGGLIVKRPIGGVTIEAWQGTSLAASVTSNSEGHYVLSGLNPDQMYTLKYHYQDEYGEADNISIDFEYPGYQAGDEVPLIELPYSMLRQMRQLQQKTLTKSNYDIKYLMDFLDFSSLNPRKTYNLDLVDQLITDWQTIDKVDAQDVINNMGRVYLSLYACNELADNAYRLSSIPAKAISELLMTTFSMLEVSKRIKKAVKKETPSIPSLPPGFSANVTEFTDKVATLVANTSIEVITDILKFRLATITDPEEKELIGKQLKAVAVTALAISGDKYDISLSTIMDLLKSLLNNELFIRIYEQHMEKTQELITSTYTKASLLAPPEQTFEIAASKVMIRNVTSILHHAQLETDEVVDLCENVFFNNADKLGMFASVNKFINELSPIIGTSPLDKVAAIAAGKIVSRGLDVLKMVNYGGALYYSYKRLSDNRKEQRRVPTLSFSPNTIFPALASNSKLEGHVVTSSAILPEPTQDAVIYYQLKLESVMQLIHEHQNEEALIQAKELMQLDSTLAAEGKIAATEIAVAAPVAVTQIPAFDDPYLNRFAVTYQGLAFSRATMAFNLNNWFLDTTAVSFLDTLDYHAFNAYTHHQEYANVLYEMRDLLSPVALPMKIKVVSMSAPTETMRGSVVPVNVTMKNFGNFTASDVSVKVIADRGFSFSSDSLFIGNIEPGQTSIATFYLTAPGVDTFTVYSAQAFAGNAEGDFETHYISSISNDAALPLSLLQFNASRVGKQIKLNWKTEQEENTDYFEIQRSNALAAFTTIGKVTASSNPELVNIYNFIDNAPLEGMNYYRLKMIDQDERYTYSSIVAINRKEQSFIAVYPNPAAHDVYITGMGVQGEKQLSMYDSYGRLVRQAKTQSQTHTFPVDDLKGIYWLRIQSAAVDETRKILVP